MKPIIIDHELLQLAESYERQFRHIFKKTKNGKYQLGKQGYIQPNQVENNQINYSYIFTNLTQAIYFRDQCKDSKKVVQLCLIFLREAFINSKDEANDCKKYELIKEYLHKNIKFLPHQQQITVYISLISFYRRLEKKQELRQAAKRLLRILLITSPSIDQRQRIRRLILQTYEQLLINYDPKSDVWSQFLRYELYQPQPNYHHLIQILHRHFPQSYMIIPLYLLLGKHENAKKLLQYFRIVCNSDRRMTQLLQKLINLSEKNNLKGIKHLYNQQIRSYKLSNFNTVMKAFFRKFNKGEIKQEYISPKRVVFD